MYHQSFKPMTLEFLSSLLPGKEGNELVLRFRLHNETRTFNYSQFCSALDLPEERPPLFQPDNTHMFHLWAKITGVTPAKLSQLYISDVQHPVLRLFFKFLRESLFACPGNHFARSGDVNILLRALCPNEAARVSIPWLLWKHLVAVSTSKAGTPIWVGGHVTRISSFLIQADPSEPGDEQVLMTKSHLVNSKYIFEGTPIQWRLTLDQAFPLIPDNIPLLQQGMASYLLQGDVPPLLNQPLDQPPPRTRVLAHRAAQARPEGAPTEGTSSGSHDHPQSFEEQMLTSMGRLELGMGTLQTDMHQIRSNLTDLSSRVGRIETDLYRSSYPSYDFCYRSHMVPPDVPAPSWYNPPASEDDYYRISLTRGLDRLTLGGESFQTYNGPTFSPDITFGDVQDFIGATTSGAGNLGGDQGGNQGDQSGPFDVDMSTLGYHQN